MSDAPVRYRNTVLYDRGGQKVTGDVLLHADGSWSASNGDEDVVEDLDGSKRLITRSFQNWHTHLAMQLNARDFSDGFPFTAGSTKPSSPPKPASPPNTFEWEAGAQRLR